MRSYRVRAIPPIGGGNHDRMIRTNRMTWYTRRRMQTIRSGTLTGHVSRALPASELVEEPALADALALLRGDLHVVRGQEVHAVGDELDLAVAGEDQAGGEVDQPPGDAVLGLLEVHDDRDPLLEPLADLAGLVEPLRLRPVDGSRRTTGLGDGPDDGLRLVHRWSGRGPGHATGPVLANAQPGRFGLDPVIGGLDALVVLLLDETQVPHRLPPYARHPLPPTVSVAPTREGRAEVRRSPFRSAPS